MTELENKIYRAIANVNGIKGSDIAAELGVEKRMVNSTLANSSALKAVVRQKRFWVYQIRDDMPWCIQQIKDWSKVQRE